MLSLSFNLFSCFCLNNNNENKKIKTYQQQNEECLDIYNFLEIKNNFNEIDNEENDDDDINDNNYNNDEIKEKFISNLKGNSLRLLPYSNRKPINNLRIFKIKLKSKINFKSGKRNFNNKINLLNRNSFNDHSTSVDTQKLLNSNRINISSFREGSLNILNRINNNSGSLRFGNSNILSFHTNRSKKAFIQNLFSNNKENNE
jgi:hypothetical protein